MKVISALCALGLACALAGVTPPAGAGTALDRFHQAVIRGQWHTAEQLVPALSADPAVDPLDLLFSIGMMAVARRDYDRAIQAFRKILAARPDLTRVRLELARAFFLNGNSELARLHFERVLGGDIPEAVAVNVRRYLGAIRQDRAWTLNLSIGYLSDSNANSGTSEDLVHFFGIPFVVDDEAKAHPGNGVSLWARGTYRYRLTPHFGIFSFASVYRRDYENSRYDDMTLRAGIGPSWSGPTFSVLLAPLAAYRTYGNAHYSNSAGVRLNVDKQLSDRWIGDTTFEWLDTKNAISAAFDEKSTRTDVYVDYSPSSTTTFRFGGNGQRLDSQTAYYSYDLLGVSLGAFHDWRHGITTGLTWAFQRLDYDGTQPFFNEARRDHITIVSASIGKRDWAIKDFMPVLSLTRIENHSSIDFFSYSRTLAEIRFDRRF